LSEPRIDTSAIDHLVIDPDNKKIIKSIVKTYTDKSIDNLFSADFIHGKGEGQIFLLHGPPGTGKTMTAGR
jgi:SpoVK/Ycf46/Vps4 family AAA+-type ATPase